MAFLAAAAAEKRESPWTLDESANSRAFPICQAGNEQVVNGTKLLILHFEKGDPEDPLNWSKPRKWLIVSHRCQVDTLRTTDISMFAIKDELALHDDNVDWLVDFSVLDNNLRDGGGVRRLAGRGPGRHVHVGHTTDFSASEHALITKTDLTPHAPSHRFSSHLFASSCASFLGT